MVGKDSRGEDRPVIRLFADDQTGMRKRQLSTSCSAGRQGSLPPGGIVLGLEILASRAHNRLQAGRKLTVREQWPHAYDVM